MLNNNCPICNSTEYNSIANSNSNLVKCSKCKVVYNINYQNISYSHNYFLDDYKKQYGKTYIEDFDNIYRLSKTRLQKIINYLNNNVFSELKLLDIGSAAGFFLKAAQDCGFQNVCGLEISEFAANYCKKQFGIKIYNKPFDEINLKEKYHIITSWYFLEHCQDTAFSANKIYQMLGKGGIFALSIPSVFGPQFMFKREQWVNSHPSDHRVDFSPATIKKFLLNLGFKNIKIYPAGIHPDRIISKKSVFYKPFSLIYPFFCKIFSFSDTIEVYALKK